MKLLPEEHKQIVDLLEQYGFDGRYDLIKKKGWVFITVGDDSFAFHRKQSSILVEGKFVDLLEYFIKTNESSAQIDDFESVLQRLADWLTGLN